MKFTHIIFLFIVLGLFMWGLREIFSEPDTTLQIKGGVSVSFRGYCSDEHSNQLNFSGTAPESQTLNMNRVSCYVRKTDGTSELLSVELLREGKVLSSAETRIPNDIVEVNSFGYQSPLL
jgi:hypothetical protein